MERELLGQREGGGRPEACRSWLGQLRRPWWPPPCRGNPGWRGSLPPPLRPAVVAHLGTAGMPMLQQARPGRARSAPKNRKGHTVRVLLNEGSSLLVGSQGHGGSLGAKSVGSRELVVQRRGVHCPLGPSRVLAGGQGLESAGDCRAAKRRPQIPPWHAEGRGAASAGGCQGRVCWPHLCHQPRQKPADYVPGHVRLSDAPGGEVRGAGEQRCGGPHPMDSHVDTVLHVGGGEAPGARVSGLGGAAQEVDEAGEGRRQRSQALDEGLAGRHGGDHPRCRDLQQRLPPDQSENARGFREAATPNASCPSCSALPSCLFYLPPENMCKIPRLGLVLPGVWPICKPLRLSRPQCRH